MSLRHNWTAREGLSFSFSEPISDVSWSTNLTTIKQLGVPGLEGDVWHVELEGKPHGISEAAVKVFKANFDMQTEFLDFIDEANREETNFLDLIPSHTRSFAAEATASIENNYFLKPYAFGKMANRNVILMPVIKGDNLSDYIRTNPDLSKEIRLKLSSELCLAIDALHESGQLHNDIKPDNIMVDTSGSEPTIKIIDLGFHCKIADVKTLHGGSRKPLGTPGYMAPEIRGWGAGTASDASDTWSVGCTIFYILTSLELIAGVLDKKSEDSQNELYNELRNNMDKSMISIERMERAGIEDEIIAEGLSQLLTPSMKIRRRSNQPLAKLAEILQQGLNQQPTEIQSKDLASKIKASIKTPAKKRQPGFNPFAADASAKRKARLAGRAAAKEGKTTGKFSDDIVKVIVRPEEGMKQILVVGKGKEVYLRHQHLPHVDTSHSKLIRFNFDGDKLYALPRDGLPGLRFDSNEWTSVKVVPTDGAAIEIDGLQIQLELR